MKLNMLAVVVVTGLTLVGTASAYNGGGNSSHHSRILGDQVYQQLDQATQDKISAFRDSNQNLRKEMIMKNSEKKPC